MFIAFEGPDNTGKSTAAAELDYRSEPTYNATKALHEGWQNQDLDTEGLVHTYDRIDWFSHMVYRLALPDHEWNDERPRTVFAMPDTHLVVRLHRPDLAEHISDELYVAGKVAQVNPLYYYFANFFTGLNEERDFALFKTITIIEVANDVRAGTYSQRLASFSSPVAQWEVLEARYGKSMTNGQLLQMLRDEDRQRL